MNWNQFCRFVFACPTWQGNTIRIACSDWLTPSNIRIVDNQKPIDAQMISRAVMLGLFKTIWMEESEGKQQTFSSLLCASLELAGKEREIESNSLRDILARGKSIFAQETFTPHVKFY
eukprot:GABV01012563.1.p1 GENE.GABV01012563.1~~GABV01012563.1.p1  ORF type:complete len:118 (-),score=32.61 GABV01012563.1:11-364(-)